MLRLVTDTARIPRQHERRRARGERRRDTTIRACLTCRKPQQHGRRLISIRSTNNNDNANSIDNSDRPEQQPEQQPEQPPPQFDDQSETLPVKVALSMLRFYKTGISPLMPPSCRFQPTCSSYAVDAYTRYGVAKGTIMTAWRLFRCTPWGDRGYDPAVWPPKGLGFLKDM